MRYTLRAGGQFVRPSAAVHPLRWPGNLVRGVFVFLFFLVVLNGYGAGRLWLWLAVRDRARRASRVAGWKGRVLRRSMTLLGATFIKMGQVMSSRPDLFPPELIAQLRGLQDKLPAFAFWRARRIIERELGRPVDEVFSELERRPVAAASVAQSMAASSVKPAGPRPASSMAVPSAPPKKASVPPIQVVT